MIDNLTLNQLRMFVCVCEESSFSAAAKRLRRAQSAVSHAVAALEDGLGVTLFEREGRKPELTAAGLLLLADAKAVVAHAEQMKMRARSITKSDPQTLRLLADVHFPNTLLVDALRDLEELAPGVNLTLLRSTVQHGEAMLLDDKCDLALVTAEVPESSSARIERRYLCETRLIAVCAPSHPLAQSAEPVTDEQLAKYTQLLVTDPVGAPEFFTRGLAGPLLEDLRKLLKLSHIG